MNGRRMKLLFVLTVLFSGSFALAGAVENVVIDEYGVGTWVDADSVTHSFSGSFLADPSGGTSSALVYDTNVGGNGFTFSVNGDYKIYTPGTEEVAGIVRFYGGHYMVFYDNDVGPGGESPADGSRLPDVPLLPMVPLDQTLVDVVSEATVLPISGMAGYETGVTRTYTFLSVLPVPEPGVLSLLACSAALLALRRKPAVS